MPKIVAVHGIGQQFKGEYELHAEWLPALRDGLSRAGAILPNGDDLSCAFYGDLFRTKGTRRIGVRPYKASDVVDEQEKQLLQLWWHETARVEDIPGPDARTRLRTTNIAQRALNALSNSKFFAGIAERAMIGDLKQVHAYLHDEAIRENAQRRISDHVANDTRILIGHSLGTVIAYEALCAHPKWPIRTFITLGSPLGIRNLIFDHLRPSPSEVAAAWPECIQQWFNIADSGDVVALVKELRPHFGACVKDVLVYNGATAHNVQPYLSAEETGRAIAAGLAA
jgi:hypothetical protein